MNKPDIEKFYKLIGEHGVDGQISTHNTIKILNLLNLEWIKYNEDTCEDAYLLGVAEHKKIEVDNPWEEEL